MLESDRERALAFQRYLERIVRPQRLFTGRDSLISSLRDLYESRLRLPQTNERVDAVVALIEDAETVLIEMAHDGQIPHLGVVRLVLKSRQFASSLPKGLALYLIGDHYTADMRPENLYLGLPLRGVDADHVKNPLTVPLGRKSRHIPFRWLPPPSNEALDALERRAEAWVVNNASYADRGASEAAVHARLHVEFERLRESAKYTRSFGDWLMRIQTLWFDELFGATPHGLAILPMSGIVDWAPEVLRDIASQDGMLRDIKAAVSDEQRTRGETPYLGDTETAGSFWVYCPTCHRRYRAAFADDEFTSFCAACEKMIVARWPQDKERVMPDIVAYEVALFRMGIAGWVVGSHAPYHEVIDKSYRALFHLDMPPKVFVTSVPRFWGLGEPPEGHARARILRALLETEPQAMREALEEPVEVNPQIRSRYL